jgi:hypothetical protein
MEYHPYNSEPKSSTFESLTNLIIILQALLSMSQELHLHRVIIPFHHTVSFIHHDANQSILVYFSFQHELPPLV